MSAPIPNIPNAFIREAVPAFRTGWHFLLCLVLLFLAAAPLSAQDAESGTVTETEKTTAVEKPAASPAGNASASGVQSARTTVVSSSVSSESRPRGVLVLFPFAASYTEHVFV